MRRDSTGLKVGITFGCLVALLTGVGWLGLSRMQQINASQNEILNRDVAKLQLANEVVFYVNSNYRMTTTLVLMKHRDSEDVEWYPPKRAENRARIDLDERKIKELAGSAKEKELLDKIEQAGGLSTRSVSDIVEMLRHTGQESAARASMTEKTIPRLNHYRDAWNDFIQFEETEIAEARGRNEAYYNATRRLSISLVLVAITLAIGIAALMISRMSRDMKNREESRNAIRKLNEGLEKKVAERTEDLARTVDTLREEVNVRRAQEVDLRRLAAIVESSGDAIIAITLNGIITDWNAGAERMLGFQRSEMIGQPISRIIPPDRLGEPNRSLQRLIVGDQVVRHETVRVRKDGRQIHVSLTISPLRDVHGKIIGDSAIFRDMSERKKMEDALRRSESGFRSLVHNAPYGILRTKPDGRIVQANPAMVQMLGYASEQEMLSLNMARDVYCRPEERERATALRGAKDSIQGVELEWKRKDGSLFTVRCDTHVVMDSEGYLGFLETFVEDVTERREMEQQLRQGQKMEAIGRLAGGVAHDFNNLLGVISGYAELVAEQVEPGSELRNSVEQIRKAASRASGLTRQLLAFSRQQVLETKILNMNIIVEDMAKMLPRLLGEDIELQTSLDPGLGAVKADQGQIEQVILNLAVNARDAMPGGGKLVIYTGRVHYDSDLALKHPAMKPGDYALLSVSDTGMGMDKQTQTHIFEPFFTTKERGRGTGLGLAMVYGFVKQIGGYVWVESEPGVGSTFAIYLPVAMEEAPLNSPAPAITVPGRGSGTVLLVEDEESLRTLTGSILEQSGYTVLAASNGMEAVDIARDYSGPIHLLLTDMVMPGMNGRAVAEKVGRLYPGIRVAYMSGYTGFSAREAASLNGVIIAKPFTRNILLQKLSETLEFEEKTTGD
jgi:two-component system, cell cycle sensor histidine kinase and response regulator CckA